ncbi:MAG: acyl-[acyl-carrier-protein] thioesterase [Leptospirales bacterium]|nr:acyl-[acyl-carrier-protein] thioesterase [Leptospirales bacterium]
MQSDGFKTYQTDLDTQRHVTSRTYERFCQEVRWQALEQEGYSIARMIDEGLGLRPLFTRIAFKKQQYAGASLSVKSVYGARQDFVYWDQSVLESGGEPAAQIELIQQWETTQSAAPPVIRGDGAPETPEYVPDKERPRNCNRVRSEWQALYSERNVFGSYDPAYYWRLFEDARWAFSSELGLSFERFVAMDTTFFYMGGNFHYLAPPQAGETLLAETWVSSLEKIRCTLRTEVRSKNSGKLLMTGDEEQLIVSLSRARPRKAPVEYLELLGDHIEGGA